MSREDELKAFGEGLKRMREKMDMTQEKLAEKLDIERSQIYSYESGRTEMGALKYVRLRRLYEEKTEKQSDELLRQLQNLSGEDRRIVEELIAHLSKMRTLTEREKG